MNKRKVIIDCDPGIDDSLALMLALKSEELEILGITIVCGNVPTRQGALNAMYVLQLMGMQHIPIYVGEEKPLERELVTAQDTHGEDGVGENYFELQEQYVIHEGAVDFIVECLRKEKLSIIALGPLTNIAKALAKDKEVFHNVERFVSMGGSYKSHGNCSPVAEFNYWVDPHGAEDVFQNLPVPIEMVGLDVTRKIVLTPNHLSLLSRVEDPLAEHIVKITKFYVDFHWHQEGILGCVINDPLAVAYFIYPELCETFASFTTIVKEGVAIGQSIVDSEGFWKRRNNSLICTEVAEKDFMMFFLERLFPQYFTIIKKVLGGE